MHQLTAYAGADINRFELVLTDAYPNLGETLQDMHCANEVRYVCGRSAVLNRTAIRMEREWVWSSQGKLRSGDGPAWIVPVAWKAQLPPHDL